MIFYSIDAKDLEKEEYTFSYNSLDSENVNIIKYLFRQSFEYKNLIYFMKNTLDLSYCAFFPNYSYKNGFIIQLHHAPFTLDDITKTIINKYLVLNKKYNLHDICEELAIIHYTFQVGLIPLNPTVHKLVHADKIVIHPDLVFGNWEKWYNDNIDYHSLELNNKYILLKEYQKTHDKMEFPNILERNETTINIKGFQKLESYDYHNKEDKAIERLKEFTKR
jgi:hypothetical protein